MISVRYYGSDVNLSQALRIKKPICVAISGSGGKTTAMFTLARELLQGSPQKNVTVILTATTHLSLDQVGMADQHFVIRAESDLTQLEATLPTGVILFTGGINQGHRTTGLDEAHLERLYQLSLRHGAPLLIEADGSRQRPLKAPADHEPVIPGFVDMVIVVAGMAGIGKTLTSEWVHRPERFSEITGTAINSLVTPTSVVKELSHPLGGLKNIPPGARRIVLLNQADGPSKQSGALQMSERLVEVFDAILIASLKGEGVYAVHEPKAAVILAAGGSSRFGRPKQLLDWKGMPLVRHIALTALESKLDEIILVTGRETEEITRVVSDLNLKIVHNPNWVDGQGTSVSLGTSALRPEIGAVLFLLADQPLVSTRLVESLFEYHARTLAPIISPLVDDRRTNPVLFDRETFKELRLLSGVEGGRALFPRYPLTWMPWYDRRLLVDIDSPADYQRLLDEYGGED